MKNIFLALTVLFFANIAFAADEPSQVPTQYVIVITPGVKWPMDGKVDGNTPFVQKHGAYWGANSAWVEKGGPFLARGSGMMLIKSGTSLEAVQKLASEDPAVQDLFMNAEVRDWILYLDSSRK